MFCPCECGAKPAPEPATLCWWCGKELIPTDEIIEGISCAPSKPDDEDQSPSEDKSGPPNDTAASLKIRSLASLPPGTQMVLRVGKAAAESQMLPQNDNIEIVAAVEACWGRLHSVSSAAHEHQVEVSEWMLLRLRPPHAQRIVWKENPPPLENPEIAYLPGPCPPEVDIRLRARAFDFARKLEISAELLIHRQDCRRVLSLISSRNVGGIRNHGIGGGIWCWIFRMLRGILQGCKKILQARQKRRCRLSPGCGWRCRWGRG